jgi:uncharacterized protein YbaP (TraB family)
MKPDFRHPSSVFCPLYSEIGCDGMKKNGWKHSVDLEGYHLAEGLGKIFFLETIEEQISVLEYLNRDQIIDFLKRVGHWHDLAQGYIRCYLAADLEQLRSKGLRFPSCHPSVIDYRDKILCERMLKYLEQGDAVAFIGAPHVRVVCELLQGEGFQIRGPGISAVERT